MKRYVLAFIVFAAFAVLCAGCHKDAAGTSTASTPAAQTTAPAAPAADGSQPMGTSKKSGGPVKLQ